MTAPSRMQLDVIGEWSTRMFGDRTRLLQLLGLDGRLTRTSAAQVIRGCAAIPISAYQQLRTNPNTIRVHFDVKENTTMSESPARPTHGLIDAGPAKGQSPIEWAGQVLGLDTAKKPCPRCEGTGHLDGGPPTIKAVYQTVTGSRTGNPNLSAWKAIADLRYTNLRRLATHMGTTVDTAGRFAQKLSELMTSR